MTCRRRRARAGGDPLDLVNATGTEDDVMPGPGGGTTSTSGRGRRRRVSGRTMDMVNAGPGAGGRGQPRPAGHRAPDPASGVDPLQETEASSVQVPGEAGGDLESGADPMPDMSGTTPS